MVPGCAAGPARARARRRPARHRALPAVRGRRPGARAVAATAARARVRRPALGRPPHAPARPAPGPLGQPISSFVGAYRDVEWTPESAACRGDRRTAPRELLDGSRWAASTGRETALIRPTRALQRHRPAQRLHERTGGNPLFLGRPGDAPTEDEAPGISEVVLRRIDRLGEPASEILALAAVRAGSLAAFRTGAAAVPRSVGVLDRAVAAGLLTPTRARPARVLARADPPDALRGAQRRSARTCTRRRRALEEHRRAPARPGRARPSLLPGASPRRRRAGDPLRARGGRPRGRRAGLGGRGAASRAGARTEALPEPADRTIAASCCSRSARAPARRPRGSPMRSRQAAALARGRSAHSSRAPRSATAAATTRRASSTTS